MVMNPTVTVRAVDGNVLKEVGNIRKLGKKGELDRYGVLGESKEAVFEYYSKYFGYEKPVKRIDFGADDEFGFSDDELTFEKSTSATNASNAYTPSTVKINFGEPDDEFGDDIFASSLDANENKGQSAKQQKQNESSKPVAPAAASFTFSMDEDF